VQGPAAASVTDAERILIRALSNTHELVQGNHVSSRGGSEEEFDPCRQARFALEQEPLHLGLGTESLMAALLQAEDVDPSNLPVDDRDHKILAECLMNEDEELTPELLEGAITALRRRHLEHQQREMKGKIADAERKNDSAALATLLREKVEIDRALSGQGRN
jgi:hypothetical protein